MISIGLSFFFLTVGGFLSPLRDVADCIRLVMGSIVVDGCYTELSVGWTGNYTTFIYCHCEWVSSSKDV